ncbi:MAG TPA: hypothetical protein VMS77_05425 [Conexivisphaerales archaeon]|nr:hypothetical protein [Conexivisphaerales archaeon]
MSQSTGPMAAPPEGFQRSGSAIATGWFDHSLIGNTLFGTLIGVFEAPSKLRADGTAKFFQVEIKQSCQVRVDRGEDAKMVEAKPGEIINVNYGPKTKGWEALVSDIKQGAIYEVWGQITREKIKLSGGRTMHAFDTRHAMVKAPVADDDAADFDGSAEGDEAASAS